MSRRIALSLLAAGLLVVAALTALGRVPAARATRVPTAITTPPVPAGFVGVDVDGPVTAAGTSIDLAAQLRGMVRAGVQSIRIAFNWAAAEPYPTLAQVPADQRAQFTVVDGVPVDFAQTDAVVAAAARERLAVLPTVLYAPPWDGVLNPGGVEFPRRPGPYAAYAAALVHRYGPHGSFWAEHPGIHREAITEWQVWNEPDLGYYWRQPFEAGYTRLLAAAHAAIKRADPSARVVLGALTNRAWIAVEQLERHRGFSRLFDVASVNGFTRLPADVILYLRYVRRALDRYGNARTPILATELSWPAATGRVHDGYDFDVTPAQAARNVATLLPMLGADARTLRLAGFDYYTWMGDETGHPANPFAYSGLLADVGGSIRPQPALAAYRAAALRLEGCAAKGPLATDCRH